MTKKIEAAYAALINSMVDYESAIEYSYVANSGAASAAADDEYKKAQQDYDSIVAQEWADGSPATYLLVEDMWGTLKGKARYYKIGGFFCSKAAADKAAEAWLKSHGYKIQHNPGKCWIGTTNTGGRELDMVRIYYI